MCVVQVMECNWDGLLKKVREAQDLDQIISAHDTFLDHITSQCLLDADGQVFCVFVQKAAIAVTACEYAGPFFSLNHIYIYIFLD